MLKDMADQARDVMIYLERLETYEFSQEETHAWNLAHREIANLWGKLRHLAATTPPPEVTGDGDWK